MKKLYALLLALLMILSLAACGKDSGSEEELTRGDIPMGEDLESEGEPDLEGEGEVDLDLLRYDAEGAYREVCHMTGDPTGYLGMTLRVSGTFSTYQSHGKTFYYCGVPDEDGCVENIELAFPGDGSLPENFPQPGEQITVVGTVSSYSQESGGQTYVYAILTDTRLG